MARELLLVPQSLKCLLTALHLQSDYFCKPLHGKERTLYVPTHDCISETSSVLMPVCRTGAPEQALDRSASEDEGRAGAFRAPSKTAPHQPAWREPGGAKRKKKKRKRGNAEAPQPP